MAEPSVLKQGQATFDVNNKDLVVSATVDTVPSRGVTSVSSLAGSSFFEHRRMQLITSRVEGVCWEEHLICCRQPIFALCHNIPLFTSLFK